MRHAYLIMAHGQFRQLERLILALDFEGNDIYLHIDIKAKEADEEHFKKITKNATVYTIKRRDVVWGDYSQIQLEMDLLKDSVPRKYDYYHLISGVDYPIKSNNEINSFFEENKGKEFVHYDRQTVMEEVEHRVGQYHLFQNRAGREKNIYRKLDTLLEKIQKIIGVNRVKKAGLDYRKGANWFSITNSLASYLVNEEKNIYKYFSRSVCADELFLQTMVYNSDFKNNLFYSEREKRHWNLRYVDWNRGNPYIFVAEDYEEIQNSECLFVRKVDEKSSSKLIDMIDNRNKRG